MSSAGITGLEGHNKTFDSEPCDALNSLYLRNVAYQRLDLGISEFCTDIHR